MKNLLLIFLFFCFLQNAFANDLASYDSKNGVWSFSYIDPESKNLVVKKFVPRNTYTAIAVSNVEKSNDLVHYTYSVYNHKFSDQIIIGTDLTGFNKIFVEVSFPDYASERIFTDQSNIRPQTMVNRIYEIEKIVKSQFKLPKYYLTDLGSEQKNSKFLMEASAGLKKIYISNIMIHADFSKNSPHGIYPNKFLSNVTHIRPELPGVIFMRFSSMPIDEKAPNETAILNQLPDTPYFENIIRQLATDAYKHTPLLGPAVEVPNPFKASVYVENLLAEVNTWTAKKVASPFMAEQLNRSLYSVKTLADGKDKERAVAEVDRLLKTVLATQTAPALSVNNLLQDGWENQPVAFIESQRDAVMGAALKANNGLHRIAARALAINLQFLVKNLTEK